MKSKKTKSKSELLEEFAKLNKEQRIKKITILFGKKCWTVLFNSQGINWRVYNYIFNTVSNNAYQEDLYTLYKYLLSIEPKEATIWNVLKEARKFADKEKEMAEKEKVKSLSAKQYKDFDLGDLL